LNKYEDFRPAKGLSNKHIQTLFSTIFRKNKHQEADIEEFKLDDGDILDCFWYGKEKIDKNKPIVIIFHGLAGSYKSPYIQGVIENLVNNDFICVLMHFRGCSGTPNYLARSYHSGETKDAKSFINSIHKNYPKNKLFAIGYSIGGNMLLKLLGELQDESKIVASVSVSAPMQLDITANSINSGFSKFYQYHLLKSLKTTLLAKYKKHDMNHLLNKNEQDIKNIKTFWEFDNIYTAPIHGFNGVHDYYKKSSSRQYIKHIKSNTLIIHALDDPFMNNDILPQEIDVPKNVKIETYANGGHLGFIAGTIFKPKYWLEDRILNYFQNYL